MNLLKVIVEETIGMFIDDGMLASLCVVLIALVTAATLWLGLAALWGGMVLLAGCIVILVWSVARAVK
ncbi:MAG TPA: hypothetical protein VGM83_07385 [Devosiaceae bacterium]|jgi:hypothetical protein